MKKKILIVSYYFSPSPTPRAIRWKSLADNFSDTGHDVTVLTAEPEPNYDEDQNTYRIIRIKENFIGRLRNKYLRKKNKILIDNFSGYKNLEVFNLFFRFIKFLYGFFLNNLQWPDFSWTWICAAKRNALNLIQDEGEFDVLISVSHPFSSHVVANSLKRKYPSLTWILDNGDPFSPLEESQPNNFFLFRSINQRIENSYLKKGSHFCVTTQETRKIYGDYFKENKNKIRVIGPILSREASINLETDIQKINEELVFSFVGTIYKNLRHPAIPIQIIDSMIKDINVDACFNFYGETNDVDISLLSTERLKLNFYGQVSREEALKAMNQSDFLINIGNTTTYQLPSKTIEYLASRKPIINFSSIHKDSSRSLFSKFEGTLDLNYEDASFEEAKAKLFKFINVFNHPHRTTISRNLKEFEIKHVSSEYQNLFS
jgi:hypothetical protein